MSTFYTTFLSKLDFSIALLLVSFEPLEIQQSNIPLLKALKCGNNAVGAQGCGCMFTFCHAYLKMGVLLHKMAIVCNQMSLAVVNYSHDKNILDSKNQNDSDKNKFLKPSSTVQSNLKF